MKTPIEQLREVELAAAAAQGDAPIELPASFVRGMVADVREAQAAREALEQYKQRVAQVMGEKPALRIVGGGEEEWMVHDVEGAPA